MSIVFHFEQLKHVAHFLGSLPQVFSRYGLTPDEVELVWIGEETKPPVAPGYYARLARQLPEGGDAYLSQLVSATLENHWKQAKAFPREQARLSASQCIQAWFPLVPEGPRPARQQDLLVAVYAEGRLAEIYASALKNPDHAGEIHYLAGPAQSPADWPRCFFTLPRSAYGTRWKLWLETIRCAHGPHSARLFYRLPARSTEAEYYVEHGWEHPVLHLAELHRAPHPGWVLIAPDAPAAGGAVQPARWTEIQRAVGRPVVDGISTAAEVTASGPFEVQLAGPMQPIQLWTTSQPRVEIPFRLRKAASVAEVDLARREHQIQAAKERLMQLQRQRAAMLRREQRATRLLLRFPAGPQSELPDDFLRFLQYSDARLDLFQYAFVEHRERKFHVLATNQAVHYEDIHYWLAKEVYYQDEYWKKYGLNVFVRDHYELAPNPGDQHLLEGLTQALEKAVRGAGGDPTAGSGGIAYLLLDPIDSQSLEVNFSITVVRVEERESACLRNSLKLLNESFHVAERDARRIAAEEWKAALDRQAGQLQAKVDEVERTLTRQGSLRLDLLCENWNQIVGRIEHDFQIVEQERSLMGVVRQMIDKFGAEWRDFATRFFAVCDALIAGKLEALDDLESAHDGWKTTMARLHVAHADVQKTLAAVSIDMDARLKAAAAGRAAAADELLNTRAKYEQVKPQINRIAREAARDLAEGQKYAGEIAAKNGEVAKQLARAKALNETLERELETLTFHAEQFGLVVAGAATNTRESLSALGRLKALDAQLAALEAQWEESRTNALETHARVKRRCEVSGAKVAQSQQTAAKLVRDAGAAIDALESKRKLVSAECAAAGDELKKAQRSLKLLEQEFDRLSKIKAEADAVFRKTKEEKSALRDLCVALQPLVQKISGHRDKTADALVGELQRSIDDFVVLANMEVAWAKAGPARDVARLQACLADGEADARPLTAEEHHAIWRE